LDNKQPVKAIKKGPEQFALVFDAHFAEITSVSLKRTLDRDVALDLSSGIYLKAFLNIHKFHWRQVRLKIWLYKIAVDEIRGYYRKKKYRPTVSVETLGPAVLHKLKQWPAGPFPDGHMDEMAKHHFLIKALNELPARPRECVTLFTWTT
jgi:DNA-directed RNA polymerase specialized sigma24 family protein